MGCGSNQVEILYQPMLIYIKPICSMHLLIVFYAKPLAVAPMKACMYSSKRNWEKKGVAWTYENMQYCANVKGGVNKWMFISNFLISVCQFRITIVASAPNINLQAPRIPDRAKPLMALKPAGCLAIVPLWRWRRQERVVLGGHMWKLPTPNTQVLSQRHTHTHEQRYRLCI